MSRTALADLRLGGVLLTALYATAALAAPPAAPIPKTGSCPSGYYTSGAYCTPTASARFTLPKTGSCPSGYYTSGDYCLASSDNSHAAVPKRGACPTGYYTSGDYCLSSR